MAWSDTTQGVNLNNAWIQWLYTYRTRLPGHLAALNTLADRPITG